MCASLYVFCNHVCMCTRRPHNFAYDICMLASTIYRACMFWQIGRSPCKMCMHAQLLCACRHTYISMNKQVVYIHTSICKQMRPLHKPNRCITSIVSWVLIMHVDTDTYMSHTCTHTQKLRYADARDLCCCPGATWSTGYLKQTFSQKPLCLYRKCIPARMEI